MKQIKNSHGMSLFYVLAALIVTGFIGSSVLKMSSSTRMSNVLYSTSASAKSAAKSGIIYGLQQLEDVDNSVATLARVNKWWQSRREGVDLVESDIWLAGGSDPGNYRELSAGSSLKFRTKILAFDVNSRTITLESEGIGSGGARATNRGVYFINGLDWGTVTTSVPSTGLTNAIYFAANQTLSNGFDVDGGIYSENNITIGGGAAGMNCNGPLICNRLIVQYTGGFNATTVIDGSMFVDVLDIAQFAKIKIQGKLGIQTNLSASSGVTTITAEGDFFLNGNIRYPAGYYTRYSPEVDNINGNDFYYTNSFTGGAWADASMSGKNDIPSYIGGTIGSSVDGGATNWDIPAELDIDINPPRPTINIAEINSFAGKLSWTGSAVTTIRGSDPFIGLRGIHADAMDGELLDSIWSYAQANSMLWKGCDGTPTNASDGFVVLENTTQWMTISNDDASKMFHKRIIILNKTSINILAAGMAGSGWHAGWTDCSATSNTLLYNYSGKELWFSQNESEDDLFRGYILNDGNLTVQGGGLSINHIRGALHDLKSGQNVYNWGASTGHAAIEWDEDALVELQQLCLVENVVLGLGDDDEDLVTTPTDVLEMDPVAGVTMTLIGYEN
jgi:hypothetical protein